MPIPVVIESPYAPKGMKKPEITKEQFEACSCIGLGECCNLCGDYMDFEEGLETNIRYCRAAMVDSLKRGEAPFASHLLYTQPGVLDDTLPEERKLGINAGFAWRTMWTKTVVYTDLGTSAGMVAGIKDAVDKGSEVEYRTLGENWGDLLK